MPSLGNITGLSDAESADLRDRLARFRATWTADAAATLDDFLPPPGARHRPAVAAELVRADLGRRGAAGLAVRVESYRPLFPGGAIPLALVVEEYRVRTRHGERPAFAEYRGRFPALADELREQLGTLPELAPQLPPTAVAPPMGATPEPDPSAGTLLSDVPFDIKTMLSPGGGPPAQPGPNSVDDTLLAEGGYRLLRRIGMGAYGEVFEALAPGGLRVAVKRILRAADHPTSQGEAESLEVMKALSHPFLLQMHAYWVARDRLVIVMELADGSLAGEIKRHKAEGRMGVPAEELVPFFEQAAEALDYLHAQRVTHRDVKPENLLLLKGYAKVADFGLARGHRRDETQVVAEVGTPLYMAPEVWKRAVNIHSDQYSLAATYVAARLGRPLFPATTLFDLCYMHVNDTPDLDPLPPAEQEVLRKGLAKRPDDRFPTCAAFARALAAAVAPPPVEVRRRTALWVGLVVLGCGAAGGLVARYLKDPVSPPPVPPPVPPPPWKPDGWEAGGGGATKPVRDGRTLYKRLERRVGGERLEALLVDPTRDTDPPPFYMTRNKITNRVFRAVWDDATGRPGSRVNWFKGTLEAAEVAGYLPGDWDRVPDDNSRSLIVFDLTPVLGVNIVEAILVAEELGGQLPTYDQWLQAAGANGNGPPPGPAGPERGAGEDLRQRPLALGLRGGPWPVGKPTTDVSVYGIHQLVTNGYEWCDTDREGKRTNLRSRPSGSFQPRLTAVPYEEHRVLTFAQIAQKTQVCEWTSTAENAGFRVVLVPR